MPEATALVAIHHLALTVSDLGRAAEWYRRVLGFEPAMELPTEVFDAVVLRHPSGIVLKLMRFPSTKGRFDERRTGLDHLAFTVRDAAAVDAWAARLNAAGVPNSGPKDGALPGSRLVVFRDPDGVQLECYSA